MEKEKDITVKQVIGNNVFAMKLAWSLDKGRVIHTAAVASIGYFLWVFYSAYFVRFVINSIVGQEEFWVIFRSILAIGAITLVLNIYTNYVEHVIVPVSNISIYNRLNQRLYKKAENVELSCFEDSNFYNKYTTALDNASEKILNTATQLSRIVSGTLAGITSFVTMYRIDKGTVLFVIAPLIGNFIFGAMVNKLTFRRYQESVPFRRKTEYVNRVMYLADYSKEIRLSNVYNLLKKDYNEAVKEICNMAKKYKNKLIPLGFLQFIFSYTVIFEGVLIYGVYKTIIGKSISFGDFAVLTSIMVTASYIWIGVMESIIESNQNGMYIQNLRYFLDYQEKIPEDYDGLLPDQEITSIVFKNVTFAYKESEPVVQNLSFTIKGGSCVALVGHNGAGKSTIVKLMFRLYDPTEGEILVNGRNIKEYNLQAYRRLFSAAFQDYKVMAASIKHNVLMGRSIPYPEKEVWEALKKAGLDDKVKKLPMGIDTVMTKEFDEEGAVFSGGEYQKLAVARAFANHVPVKVFDEPSSALDPIAEFQLFDSILQDGKNNTLIFISHRLSSVKNADLVFMLEQGQLMEQRTHEELMEMGGIYSNMYTEQAMNYFAAEDGEEITGI